jgi:hypothetical protein
MKESWKPIGKNPKLRPVTGKVVGKTFLETGEVFCGVYQGGGEGVECANERSPHTVGTCDRCAPPTQARSTYFGKLKNV